MNRNHSLLLGIVLAGTIAGPIAVMYLRAALVVNTNFQAINAQNKLNKTIQALTETFERISSGLRINKAADDARGLGVSENLDAEVRAFKQGLRNANDAISVIQTAEGATNDVANIIKRMRELAVQSVSETLGTEERAYIDDEFEQLKAEVERIAQTTTFGNLPLDIQDNGTSASPHITVTTDLLQNRLKEIGAMLHTALQLLKDPPLPQNTKKKFFTMQSPALQQISAAEKLMGKTQKEVVKSMGAFQKKLQEESDRIATAVTAFERTQRASQSSSAASSSSSSMGKKRQSKKTKGPFFTIRKKK